MFSPGLVRVYLNARAAGDTRRRYAGSPRMAAVRPWPTTMDMIPTISNFLRAGVVVLVLAWGVGVGVGAPERPNIVVIISDDQAHSDFGFSGHPVIQTPHLDRLVARSAHYVNGYVPASLCRPSLATLLTGLYPHQHGIHFNHPPPGLAAMQRGTARDYRAARARAEFLIQAVPTLPRFLAESGYASFQAGKHWEGDFRQAGFTHGMTMASPSKEPAYGNRRVQDGLVAHGNGDAGLNIGRTTMAPVFKFIDAHREQPFLLWYAPFMPHTPHDPPRRHLDRYAEATLPEATRKYYAACSWFDETVGQLVAHLEQRRSSRSTLFVFVIDNGWAPGKRGRRAKRSPYDLGVRTPILIRWDGQVRPARHRALVSSVDIVPTILEAAGLVDKAVQLPGISLLPSARGDEKLDPRRTVFGAIYPGDARSLAEPSNHVDTRWARQERYRLIVPVRDKPMLFDVVADPLEMTNLASDPSLTPVMRLLRGRLDRWWTPGDDAAVAQPPPPRGPEGPSL